jgi:hypothetical protein
MYFFCNFFGSRDRYAVWLFPPGGYNVRVYCLHGRCLVESSVLGILFDEIFKVGDKGQWHSVSLSGLLDAPGYRVVRRGCLHSCYALQDLIFETERD